MKSPVRILVVPHYPLVQYSGILIEKMRRKHEEVRPKMTCQ